MKPITPHLWFDTQAKEACEFYTSIFPKSKIISSTVLHNTPSGDCDLVSFELAGHPFMAISAGPYFKFNPAVSFMVNFDPSKDPHAKENLDILWSKLSEGGKALMPLDKYPFSEHYGWIQDKYGVTWQLILTKPEGEERPFIVPSIMFTRNVFGKAEEATNFYISIFENAPHAGQTRRGIIAQYPKEMGPDTEGKIMFTDFALAGQWFAAMDGAGNHEFNFNEAISFVIPCESQAEIDYFWDKLSADPKVEQCGWLKDKYGFSWQVTPAALEQMQQNGTLEQINRVTKALLTMKKFDIAALEKAYKGE